MIKSFTHNEKFYFCKNNQTRWSQWACHHKDGLETWAGVHVPSYKLKRQDVINAINDVDNRTDNSDNLCEE